MYISSRRQSSAACRSGPPIRALPLQPRIFTSPSTGHDPAPRESLANRQITVLDGAAVADQPDLVAEDEDAVMGRSDVELGHRRDRARRVEARDVAVDVALAVHQEIGLAFRVAGDLRDEGAVARGLTGTVLVARGDHA